MKYIWDNIETLSKYTGGGKASRDVSFFVKKEGYLSLPYYNSNNLFLKGLYRLLNFLLFPFLIKSGSELLIQYPFNGGQRFILKYFKYIKNLKCTFLVHDLDSVRVGGSIYTEQSDLNMANKIIALNEPMSEYIKNTLHIKNTTISLLKLWDYHILPLKENIQYINLNDKVKESIKVLVTGNLNSEKARYLENLHLVKGVHFYLLGQTDKNYSYMHNVTYLGCFDSNKPIELVCNDPVYGLVWDGDSINTCQGFYGHYLKYNLPHKTSFYLSNKLPIIVWDRAYVSEILEQYNVAYKIKSLYEIPSIVNGSREFNIELYRRVGNGCFLLEALRG